MEKEIYRQVFSFNPNDNGGEQLVLITKYLNNGDGEIYINQSLELYSYCNSAAFNLVGAVIDSKMLRELANQLDKAEIEAAKLLAEKK